MAAWLIPASVILSKNSFPSLCFVAVGQLSDVFRSASPPPFLWFSETPQALELSHCFQLSQAAPP